MKRAFVLMAAAATLLLSACNNDDDDGNGVVDPGSNQVPASATASPQAYAEYTNTMSATRSETALPLLVDNVVPPTTETGAPLAF